MTPMSNRVKRSFRPDAESVEERCVATAHTLAAGAELHDMAARHRANRAALVLARHPQTQAATGSFGHGGGPALADRPEIAAFRAPRRHAPPRSGPGPVTPPNAGNGLIRLGLPSGYLDYGVVSLWNNTNTTVTFAISASTYRNGQAFFFTFRPGQNQSFFAPVVNGFKPLFQVSFQPNLSNPIPLAQENIVFESPRYFPQGTAG
jgi:hypothetical protein